MPDGLTPTQLAELRKYDTPTVCNVIELFAVRTRTEGYMDRRIRACFPEMPSMVGYASTATYRSSSPAPTGSVYATIDAQVAGFADLPGPAVVVFQDLDDPPTAATFGEVMCTCYQTFGAAGLITSGTGRDLEQVRALGFPAFADGAIASHGYAHLLESEVPVRVGGLTVRPGDLLHGDANGVTSIPGDIAADVVAACADFVACEQVVLDYLRAGGATPRGLGRARAECTRRIEELGRRVRTGR